MGSRFDSFVLFAEMRTGSNFLEETLNLYPGLRCWGEAFNPAFIGQHNWTDILGVTKTEREADPLRLIARMKEQTKGLPGFRFFHDHDPRVLAHVLPEPRCAKVVLTRNPLDSYVSRKIAQATDQWRLTNVKHRREAKIRFDLVEFEMLLDRLQGFQLKLQRALQVTGQTAFYLAYEDVNDIDVLNGLARYLGIETMLDAPSDRLKRQNPAPLTEKVVNHEEMVEALAQLDRFDLARTPSFEPRRGPAVPTYIAAAKAPVLFMPMKGGATNVVADWLAALDEVASHDLIRGFTQKTLRQWKNRHKAGRAFTVVSHPLARAHSVFCQYVLDTGPESFAAIRRGLRDDQKLPIPEGAVGPSYSRRDHRLAFEGFLHFIRANLAGQTGKRTDPAWISQSVALQNMSEFVLPDMVIREDQLGLGLAQLCQQIGRDRMPPVPAPMAADPIPLADIYDDDLEALARDVYNRDFMTFGFKRWGADQAA